MNPKRWANSFPLYVLGCPLHPDDGLDFDIDHSCCVCKKCGAVYYIRQTGDFVYPDFLVNATDYWKRGERLSKTKFLRSAPANKAFSSQSAAASEESLVLDLGCGERHRGTVNLDCYVPNAFRPINFVLGNAELPPFRTSSFDSVLSFYNIEHMIRPSDYIVSAVRLSKRSVKIVTDNSEWIGDVVFRVIGDGRIFHDEHYYKWSPEYLRNLVKRLNIADFNVVACNLSPNPVVRFIGLFSILPRIGSLFCRDLVLEIRCAT